MTTVTAITGIDPQTNKSYLIFASDTQATREGGYEMGQFGPFSVRVYRPPSKQEAEKILMPQDMRYVIGRAGVALESLILPDIDPKELRKIHPEDRKVVTEKLRDAREMMAYYRLLTGEAKLADDERERFEKSLLEEIADTGQSPFVKHLNDLQEKVLGPGSVTSYLLGWGKDGEHRLYNVTPNGKAQQVNATAIGSGNEVAFAYLETALKPHMKKEKGKNVLYLEPEKAVRYALEAVGEATDKDLYSSGADLVVVSEKKRSSFRKDIEKETKKFKESLVDSLEDRVKKLF